MKKINIKFHMEYIGYGNLDEHHKSVLTTLAEDFFKEQQKIYSRLKRSHYNIEKHIHSNYDKGIYEDYNCINFCIKDKYKDPYSNISIDIDCMYNNGVIVSVYKDLDYIMRHNENLIAKYSYKNRYEREITQFEYKDEFYYARDCGGWIDCGYSYREFLQNKTDKIITKVVPADVKEITEELEEFARGLDFLNYDYNY